MVEHIIVFFVLVRIIKSLFRIESRGKLGLVPYVTKLLVRYSKKVPFINNKIQKYLEGEAVKSIEEVLAKKEVKCEYSTLPEEGMSQD